MGDLATPVEKPVILPIVTPQIHWDTFLMEVRKATGDSLTRSMDQHEVKPRSDQSIVAALAQFRQGGYLDPYKAIRNANAELKLLTFSFLCVYFPYVFHDLSLETEISVIRHHSANNAYIIGGNLNQWKSAVVTLSEQRFSFPTRYFSNCLMLAFQCNGYSQIWESWSKRMHQDGTFTLELKHGGD